MNLDSKNNQESLQKVPGKGGHKVTVKNVNDMVLQ